jgi:hypothetical protein
LKWLNAFLYRYPLFSYDDDNRYVLPKIVKNSTLHCMIDCKWEQTTTVECNKAYYCTVTTTYYMNQNQTKKWESVKVEEKRTNDLVW